MDQQLLAEEGNAQVRSSVRVVERPRGLPTDNPRHGCLKCSTFLFLKALFALLLSFAIFVSLGIVVLTGV